MSMEPTVAIMVNQLKARAEAAESRIAELEAALREARDEIKCHEETEALTGRTDSDALLERIHELERQAAELREAAENLSQSIWKVQDWGGTHVGDASDRLDSVLSCSHGRDYVPRAELEAAKAETDAAWTTIERCCQQAWPTPQGYAQSPTELIARIINERDEARKELEAAQANAVAMGEAIRWKALVEVQRRAAASAKHDCEPMRHSELEAAQAEAAAMREAIEQALRELPQTIDYSAYNAIAGALDADAGRALLEEVERLRASTSAVRASIAEKINHCCGDRAGEQACDCYGCGTLKKFEEMLR